jgi:hypothetical protein
VIADDVIAYLIAQGQSASVLFKELPEDPRAAVAVIAYSGANDAFAMGASLSAPAVRKPRFQVVVRNLDRATAWTTAETLKGLLHNFQGTMNGTRYLLVELQGSLYELAPADGALAYRVQGNYEATR